MITDRLVPGPVAADPTRQLRRVATRRGPSHLATDQISFGCSRGNAAELREPVEVWTEPVRLQLEFQDTIRRSTLPPALGSAPCELAFGLSDQLWLGSERLIGLSLVNPLPPCSNSARS
jgi:hypothetical protein